MHARWLGGAFYSLAILVLSGMLVGCGTEEGAVSMSIEGKNADPAQKKSKPKRSADAVILREDVASQKPSSPLPSLSESEKHPNVQIKTSLGDITIRLDADVAPQTVENFLENYVSRKHYDQTIFHFAEKGFIIQGGGFTEDLKAKETRTEIINEADNGRKNKRGTIGMARDPAYVNSATCQFYINVVDNPSLDHKNQENDEDFGYCVFGTVIQGMDVVDKIAQSKVHEKEEFLSLPLKTVMIHSVRIIR